MTVQYTDPFGPQWKLPWLKMMTQWSGSIFQFFLVEWLAAISIYAIVLFIWYMALRDPSSSYGDQPIQQYLFEAFGYVTGRFQAALSLMLGFYTSTLYTRWWKVRDVEGVVIGRINDIAVQIAALVRDAPMGRAAARVRTVSGDESLQEEKKSEQSKSTQNLDKSIGSLDGTNAATGNDVRLNLVRWLNLAHALAIGELYEKKPNAFSSLEDLVEFGMLSHSEYEYMKHTTRSRYVAPFVWFLNLVQELKDKDYCEITDGTMIILTGNVTRIRGSLADLYMYRNVPVPLSYRQLVNWTVRTYMVIFAVAGALGSILTDDGNLGGLTPSVFFLLVPFAFEYFMFIGWLELADALGNPFRAWADEFEYENYVKSVALGSNQCITTSRDACTPLEDIHQITQSLKEKSKETLTRWNEASNDHESDPLRVKLTGF